MSFSMRYTAILCLALSTASSSCPPQDTVKQLFGNVEDKFQDSLPKINGIVKDVTDIIDTVTGDSTCLSGDVSTCISKLLKSTSALNDVKDSVSEGGSIFSDVLSSITGAPWKCLVEDGFDFANQTVTGLEPVFTPFLDELKKLLELDEQLIKEVAKLLTTKIHGGKQAELKSPINIFSHNLTEEVKPVVSELDSLKSVPTVEETLGGQIDEVGSALNNLTSSINLLY